MDPERFPANSYRIRGTANTTKNTEPREKAEKIVIGEVIQRKPPWTKRVTHYFFGGDARTVRDYVVLDVLGPALKDMILDVINQGSERAMYGEVRSRSRRGSMGRTVFTAYDRFATQGRVSGYGGREDPRGVSGRRGNPRSARDIQEIIVESRPEAEEVIARLEYYVDKYDAATVADLNEMLGITGDYTDEKQGWTDMRGASFKRIHDGYLLLLPRVEALD